MFISKLFQGIKNSILSGFTNCGTCSFSNNDNNNNNNKNNYKKDNVEADNDKNITV